MPGHRTLGSGATTVTVRHRSDKSANGDINPGYIILIGRRLWQDIGQPQRVSIHSDAPGYFEIRPIGGEGGWKITNIDQDGMPRISIGKSAIESIHLPEGTFEASAGSMIIRFRV